VTNGNLLIGKLQINTGCKVFNISVLLQASCTAISDVTLKEGDLLTQNCTSMTVVKKLALTFNIGQLYVDVKCKQT